MSIVTTITVSKAYTTALSLQLSLSRTLSNERDTTKLTQAIQSFEDSMNGLSGKIASLPLDQQTVIQTENERLKNSGKTHGLPVYLAESLLPPVSSAVKPTQTNTTTAKRLYPRTETVRTAAERVGIVNATITPSLNATILSAISTANTIDPIFDYPSAVADRPVALNQSEPAPLIVPQGIVDAALRAAANTEGLQAGLVEFNTNPLADIIDDTQRLILYYTSTNYDRLNTALTLVNACTSISGEYTRLRESIGGGDGLSNAVSQLDSFMDHTNRLSGLVIANTSPNAEQDDNSMEEFLHYENVSGDLNEIISFDSNKFRTARYWVQATSGRKHQATELFIVHDNKFVYTREIASLYTQDPFIVFTSQLYRGRIYVLANTALSNTDFVIYGLRLRIARNSGAYSDMDKSKILENHSTLAANLQDDVDYVALQSASLYKPQLAGNLARDLRDLIADMSTPFFDNQSVAYKQDRILNWANTMITRTQEVQTGIDADYAAFKDAQKKAEAFQVGYHISTAYSDPIAKTSSSSTLNSTIRTTLDDALNGS